MHALLFAHTVFDSIQEHVWVGGYTCSSPFVCVCYHVFLENISLHFSTRMSKGKYYNGPKEMQLPYSL